VYSIMDVQVGQRSNLSLEHEIVQRPYPPRIIGHIRRFQSRSRHQRGDQAVPPSIFSQTARRRSASSVICRFSFLVSIHCRVPVSRVAGQPSMLALPQAAHPNSGFSSINLVMVFRSWWRRPDSRNQHTQEQPRASIPALLMAGL